MGCDIHSFVMVPSGNAGLYKPLVGYVYSTRYKYWRTVQPYDDRYYEMYGLLTAGGCRGGDYTDLGINPHIGRFNKTLVDPTTIDPKLIPDNSSSEETPHTFNTIAIDYFNEDNVAGWHTHGWVSLADLKRFKRRITRNMNNESLDIEQRGELIYLKNGIKKIITNTKAIVNYNWEDDVDDDHVIVCFCFDS